MGHYTCCCCIPIRAGVLIIALLTAALYITSTVFQFMADPTMAYAGTGVNIDAIKGVHYTSIAISIIVSLASLFGVVGCVSQHRTMIAIFKVAFWTVTIIEMLSSIAIIIALIVQRSAVIDACAAYYSTETPESCSTFFRNYMIIFSLVVLFVNIIQFYFATVISAYAARLRRTNLHEKLRNLEDFPEPPSKTEFF